MCHSVARSKCNWCHLHSKHMTRQELVYCNYDSKHNNLLTLKPKRTLGEENVIPVKLNSIQCWPQTIHDTCTCSWFKPCPHWLTHITLYMMSWIMHTFIGAYYWSIGGQTHRWHHHWRHFAFYQIKQIDSLFP